MLKSLSVPSGVTNLSMPRDCSTTHLVMLVCFLFCVRNDDMKVCRTLGVWLECESILRKLPRVSEVALIIGFF